MKINEETEQEQQSYLECVYFVEYNWKFLRPMLGGRRRQVTQLRLWISKFNFLFIFHFAQASSAVEGKFQRTHFLLLSLVRPLYKYKQFHLHLPLHFSKCFGPTSSAYLIFMILSCTIAEILESSFKLKFILALQNTILILTLSSNQLLILGSNNSNRCVLFNRI